MFGMKRARRLISAPTWSASSRVGQSTNACTCGNSLRSRDSSAKPNATVLPLPARA
jgi:hypothetical protein